MYKVAFMGTHGVGKTTTVEWMEEILEDRGYVVETVKDSARDCPMPINQTTTLESQLWILFEQIQQELECKYKAPDIVLCDRTALDAQVYTEVNLGVNQLMNDIVDDWMDTYDLLFKLDRNIEFLEDDGLRDTDVEFWKEVDNHMDRLIREKGVNVIASRSKSPQLKNKIQELLIDE